MASHQADVLVTGAGGFIGGHLVADLVGQGKRVRAADSKHPGEWFQRSDDAENIQVDLSSLENCRRVTSGIGQVYNLAADMGGMGFIESNKALCMLSVLIDANMLIASRDDGVESFFYSSSACVYAAEKQTVADVVALQEDDVYPAMPEDGYGWQKLYSERLCRHFMEDFGLETRVARYHNVYGPEGAWRGGREKAPAAICRKVATAATSGSNEIEIWGDGEQTRSFTFISDCVSGSQLIAHGTSPQPVNLGSSELVTINQLVSLVEDIAGVHLDRRYDLSAPLGVRGRNSDNTMIQRTYGWSPSVTLREGLAATYWWIHEQVLSGAPVAG
jgi:nucleoside-diphosphate-sugar epimerase